jgi:hypothetical protein
MTSSKFPAALFLLSSAFFTFTACNTGGECVVDDDCASDACVDGACVDCENDRDCDDDEQCDDGECRDAEENGGEGEGEGSTTGSLAVRACDRFEECDLPPPEQGTCDGNLQDLFDTVASVDDSLCASLDDALQDAFECETTAPCSAMSAGTECPSEWERVNDLIVDGADACIGGNAPSEEPSEDPPADPSNAPSGWQCDDTYFGDGLCDCGCGVTDADCSGGQECVFCFEGGVDVACAADEPDPQPEPGQSCNVSAFANPSANGSLAIAAAIVTVSDDNFANCPTATQIVFLSMSGSMTADLDGDEISISSNGNVPFLCAVPSFVDDGVLGCIICGGTTASSALAAQVTDDVGNRTAATCVEPG